VGREGDESSAPTTSIRYHCSLASQVLPCTGIVTGTTGWLRAGYLIEVNRNFGDEMINSYNRLVDDDNLKVKIEGDCSR
jgi:hypothetical protein